MIYQAKAYWRRVRLKEQVNELFNECNVEGWDGYSSCAVTYEAHRQVLRLIDTLPISIISPDIVPEPSGTIGLQWHNSDTGTTLALKVSQSILFYALVSPNEKNKWPSTF